MAALPPDLEQMVIAQLRDKRKSFRKSGLTMAILGVALAAASYFALDPPHQNLWVICVAMVPIGGLFSLLGGFGDLREAKILKQLRTRADDVVWLFTQTQPRRQMSHVVLGLRDGKRLAVWAKLGTEQETLDALRRIAPRAVVGYSAELENRFASDPAGLARA